MSDGAAFAVCFIVVFLIAVIIKYIWWIVGAAAVVGAIFLANSVRWWALADDDLQIDAFEALWPGWSAESIGDAYELHEKTIGQVLRDRTEDVAALQRIVQAAVDGGPRENPVLRMAAVLSDRGERIAIQADALKFNAASDFGGAPTAVAALDSALALAPARIVNRHGRIFVPTSMSDVAGATGP